MGIRKSERTTVMLPVWAWDELLKRGEQPGLPVTTQIRELLVFSRRWSSVPACDRPKPDRKVLISFPAQMMGEIRAAAAGAGLSVAAYVRDRVCFALAIQRGAAA